MAPPFPGMNPYLENPDLWPEVHSRLIVAMADALNPQLIPTYRAAIDQRVYGSQGSDSLLVGIPDVTVEQRSQTSDTESDKGTVAVMPPPSSPVKVTVPMPIEIRERYLTIKAVATGEVITVVELLSPSNKRAGAGRNSYEEKRRAVLSSQSHLVEIDLLRKGEPMSLATGRVNGDYRILVSRSEQRPQADLYAFNLRDEIPRFPLPLQETDQEPMVDLKLLLDQVYERAGYEVVIDYAQAPVPPLAAKALEWVQQFIGI